MPLPAFLTISDYDRRVRLVATARILDVRAPGAGVHDHGDLRLDTGIVIAFSCVEECQRVMRLLKGNE